MEENVKVKSWGAIITAFILLWPLGLYWYVKRIKINRKDALNSWKVMLGFGIWFIFEGLVTLAVGIGFLYLIGGIVLLTCAIVSKKNSEKIKKYISIIVNSGVTQLSSIAAMTRKPIETVESDIQQMIEKQFLKTGTYIDMVEREIKFSSVPNSTVGAPSSVSIESANTSLRTVVCKCCGASNTVASTTAECEYCGTVL